LSTNTFSGHYSTELITRVLNRIATEHLSGTLTIVKKEQKASIIFNKGVTVSFLFERSWLDSKVIEYLEKAGLISYEIIKKCREKQLKEIKSCTQILIDDGYISMLFYIKLKSIILSFYITALFFEHNESYFFTEEEIDLLPDIKYLSPLDIISIINSDISVKKWFISPERWIFEKISLSASVPWLNKSRSMMLNYLGADKDATLFLPEFMHLLSKGAVSIPLLKFSPENIFIWITRAVFLLTIPALLFFIEKNFAKEELPEPDAGISAARISMMKRVYYLEHKKEADIEKLYIGGYITEREYLSHTEKVGTESNKKRKR